MKIHALFYGVAALATAIAAVTDHRKRVIPNAVTLTTLCIGLVLHTVVPMSSGWGAAGRGLLESLIGALICGLPPFLCFARGDMGGGDVKLFAAIGAVCGAEFGLLVLAFSQLLVILHLPVRLYQAHRSKEHGGRRSLGELFRNLPPIALGPWTAAAFVFVSLGSLVR